MQNLFIPLILVAFLSPAGVLAETVSVSCHRVREISVKMPYEFSNATVRYQRASTEPAQFVFKFRDQKTGKLRTFRGPAILLESPGSENYHTARIDLREDEFSHVDFVLSKNPNEGAYGFLWLKSASEPVGGGVLRCLRF